MSTREDDDSDAPEEVSAQQGIQQDEEIRKAQELSKARARREGKERRKKWAEKLTPRPKKAKPSEANDEMIEDEEEVDTSNQSQANTGMLPNDIVNLLAAREKQVFLSDSEDEKEEKEPKPKKKTSKSGYEILLKKIYMSADLGKPFIGWRPAMNNSKRYFKPIDHLLPISRVETVILKELPPPHCVQNSLDFLNKRKSQVPRSAAVLTNSNQALRLLSSSGLLK